MKIRNIIVLAIIVFCSRQATAQVMTLHEVLRRIEENSPMLKMYDEQIYAIKNYSQMTKSWMAPTISSGLWQTPYSSIGDGMLMITAEQMIPNPAKQKANFDYMQGMIPVEQQGKTAKKNEMFAMAKDLYYNWIILQKKYDVLTQTDSLMNYILKTAHLRYTYNREKLPNIYKAQADLYVVRTMETMISGEMKQKNIALNTLMNIDKYYVFQIDTSVLPRSYELMTLDTSIILSARSDIKQFDANIALTKLQQQYESSKRFPEFGVSVSHMQALGMMPNQFSVMGMVSIPFAPWASAEYESTIQGLDNTANAMSYQKQALVNETVGAITAQQVQMQTLKQQLLNYKTNIIPSYYNGYQTSLLAYEQNTEDLFVVLDALRMYRMARIDELDIHNMLLMIQVNYEKALEIR